jgi:hypothetical protein
MFSGVYRIFPFFVFLLALLLEGCGGGASSNSVSSGATISGTAAVGTPIVNGSIKVTCASGNPLSTTTNNVGSWSVVFSGQTLPCAIEVSAGSINGIANATSYHSIAVSAGNVNVTPLTDLIVANLVGSSIPTTWFSGLTATQVNTITATQVNAAVANVAAALPAFPGFTTTNNPITTSFSPTSGNVIDDFLTALASAIANTSGVTYASLLNNISTATIAAPNIPTGFSNSLATGYSGTGSAGGGANYTVSVTVTSTLSNGESFIFGLGAQRATVTAQNSAVSFSQGLASGSTYTVIQISGPRTCTLAHASGTLSSNASVSADCSSSSPNPPPNNISTYSGMFSANIGLTLVNSDVAAANLSGFVVDTANSVVGDVTKYINGHGTAIVTVTPLGCSPVAQSVDFSAALWVWSPSSTSAGGALASRYSLVVDQASFPVTNAICGGTPVPTSTTALALAMDCANSWPTTQGAPTLSSTQPYTDPGMLTGSVNLSCTVSGGGAITTTFTEQFQWNLVGQ